MSHVSRPLGVALLAALTMVVPAMAQDEAPAEAAAPQPAAPVEQTIGYFLGFSVGQQMVQQGFQTGDFDVNAMANGVKEALAGSEPNLTDAQLAEVSGKIESILRTRQEAAAAETEKSAAMNKEKSSLFMQQNAKKEGIKTLDGGIQYKVLASGDGESPSAADTVKVHYTGRLTNGKVFDSSVERGEPATFRVGMVIKGWQTALQNMKVGDKWVLYIPPELAYGAQGVPGAPGAEPTIGPNEVLIFEVELLEIL